MIALLATLVGGYPILREALSALCARRMTMELSSARLLPSPAEPEAPLKAWQAG